jgi:hypothetical protein
MLTRCAKHQFYEIGDVMSREKKIQKRSPGKRPVHLFEIFDERTLNTTKNTTNDAATSTGVAVGAAEPAIPTETVANSPSTIKAEGAVSEDDVNALLLGEKRLLVSDDDATISDLALDDEEVASTRAAEEQAAVASFGTLLAMGFDGKEVLLALAASKCDEDLALEYLLSGIPQERSEEVDLGDPAATTDQENVINDCGSNDIDLSQEGREHLVVLRTRSKGFSEEEIARILHVFRQDRMAAPDLELEGPSSARAATLPRRVLTNATLPPRSPTLTPGPEYISPFTNGYITTSPPVHSHSTNQTPTKESLKRTRGRSSDTAAPRKKQKKRPRAPTPPRYKGLTREEYMKQSFGQGWQDKAP